MDDEIFFHDYPDFTPTLSPFQMLEWGVFGGTYFNSGHVFLQLPSELREKIKNIPTKQYALSSPRKEINKFGVLAGKSREWWDERDLINYKYDSEGWFHWYCNFYYGRRCPDDNRQIKRWQNYNTRHKAGYYSRLIKKGGQFKKLLTDPTILPKYKQSLTQWAIDPTDFDRKLFIKKAK